MEWWYHVAAVAWIFWIFLVGLGVGSFLNVLVARLPYEKSIIWPGSRCGNCFRSLKFFDNLPILGYLRLRGKCRFCGATFSSRYLWLELGTGLAFVALFLVEVMTQSTGGPEFLEPWHNAPGMRFPYIASDYPIPPLKVLGYFFIHAFLLSMLIAAAVVDAEHRIIPPQITYTAAIIGIIASTALPWPWPLTDAHALSQIPTDPWILPEVQSKIPTGLCMAPFWGPPPTWAPAGSWQLGLLNGLLGAAAGTAIVRVFKFLFEVGFGQDALGLGDADLLMMAGAFLGWQVVVIGFFAGAVVAIITILPPKIWGAIRGRPVERELSFGPGLAGGVILTWFGWPWIAPVARVMFDPIALGITTFVMCGGILAAGLLLRRGK